MYSWKKGVKALRHNASSDHLTTIITKYIQTISANVGKWLMFVFIYLNFLQTLWYFGNTGYFNPHKINSATVWKLLNWNESSQVSLFLIFVIHLVWRKWSLVAAVGHLNGVKWILVVDGTVTTLQTGPQRRERSKDKERKQRHLKRSYNYNRRVQEAKRGVNKRSRDTEVGAVATSTSGPQYLLDQVAGDWVEEEAQH